MYTIVYKNNRNRTPIAKRCENFKKMQKALDTIMEKGYTIITVKKRGY